MDLLSFFPRHRLRRPLSGMPVVSRRACAHGLEHDQALHRRFAGVLLCERRGVCKLDRQAGDRMYAPPPKSIMICGIRDYPCVTYAVSLHPPTETYGDGPGEGV